LAKQPHAETKHPRLVDGSSKDVIFLCRLTAWLPASRPELLGLGFGDPSGGGVGGLLPQHYLTRQSYQL